MSPNLPPGFEIATPLHTLSDGRRIYKCYDITKGEYFFITLLPTGGWYRSDVNGHVASVSDPTFGLAMLAGLAGLAIAGPVAGLIGAAIGAIAAKNWDAR